MKDNMFGIIFCPVFMNSANTDKSAVLELTPQNIKSLEFSGMLILPKISGAAQRRAAHDAPGYSLAQRMWRMKI